MAQNINQNRHLVHPLLELQSAGNIIEAYFFENTKYIH